jgi:hypothetical protein
MEQCLSPRESSSSCQQKNTSTSYQSRFEEFIFFTRWSRTNKTSCQRGFENFRKQPSEICQRCLTCNKNFKNQASLVNHLQEMHRDTNNCKKGKYVMYTCPHCPKTFSVKVNRDIHVKIVHFAVDYSCMKCRRVYRNQDIFQNHIRYSHGEQSTGPKDSSLLLLDVDSWYPSKDPGKLSITRNKLQL